MINTLYQLYSKCFERFDVKNHIYIYTEKTIIITGIQDGFDNKYKNKNVCFVCIKKMYVLYV